MLQKLQQKTVLRHSQRTNRTGKHKNHAFRHGAGQRQTATEDEKHETVEHITQTLPVLV